VSQQLVLEALEELTTGKPFAPTVRELAEATGLALSTVHAHLAQLRARGLVDWVDGHVRTLHVIKDEVG
jgi:DNA-binding IclR family transcriptional regulator